MSFIINSQTTNGQTVTANVTFTLANGYTETVDVPIFQPQNISDVINGVASRELTIQSQHG